MYWTLPSPHLTTYPPQSQVDLVKLDHLLYSRLCSQSYGIDLAGTVNVDYDVSRILAQVGDITEQFLRRIVYLGPLRSHPLRTYPWTGVTSITVGNRGEQAIQVLLGDKSASVNDVSKWLRTLGLAESLSLRRVGHGARTWEPIIRHQSGAAEVNLADVGFGVSQVLPVIVALLSAPHGSLLILEHPDIHLHPKAQAVLADLLIEVASAREHSDSGGESQRASAGPDSAADCGVVKGRWRAGTRGRAAVFLRAGAGEVEARAVGDAAVGGYHELA